MRSEDYSVRMRIVPVRNNMAELGTFVTRRGMLYFQPTLGGKRYSRLALGSRHPLLNWEPLFLLLLHCVIVGFVTWITAATECYWFLPVLVVYVARLLWQRSRRRRL